MKYALLLLLVFVSVLHADVTRSMRDEFLTRIKDIAQSEEKDRYLLLVCTDGLCDDMLKSARSSSEYTLSEINKNVDSVKFKWVRSAKDDLDIMVVNGYKHIPNLNKEATLVISWHDKLRKSDVNFAMSLGVKDGRLIQVGTIKEPISKK